MRVVWFVEVTGEGSGERYGSAVKSGEQEGLALTAAFVAAMGIWKASRRGSVSF